MDQIQRLLFPVDKVGLFLLKFDQCPTVINMHEFHKREEQQESKGTLYCLELTQEDENEESYCIDGGYSGNHARFINHSVS